jgi:uncharacterized Fe-S cluster protein YjdI
MGVQLPLLFVHWEHQNSQTNMATKHYEAGDLTIVWKPGICAHSGICVRNLPGVFKPREKPWIQPEHADSSAIAAAIDQCPSGALSYLRKGDAPPAAPAAAVVIEVMPNGPIIIQGDIAVKYDGTEERPANGRVALCRCGASERKPYCDGAHRKIGFEAK